MLQFLFSITFQHFGSARPGNRHLFRFSDDLQRCLYPSNLYYLIMGDKSPKSKQKNKNQKASKTAADDKKKRSDIKSKQQPKPGDSKKK